MARREHANCIKKSTKKNKKLLHSHKLYVILTLAVTLIAMKREVATEFGRFSVERMSS